MVLRLGWDFNYAKNKFLALNTSCVSSVPINKVFTVAAVTLGSEPWAAEFLGGKTSGVTGEKNNLDFSTVIIVL